MRKSVFGWSKTLRALGFRVRWDLPQDRQRDSSTAKSQLHYGNLEPRQLLAAPQVESWLRNDYFIEQPGMLARPDQIDTISVVFDQNVNVSANDLVLENRNRSAANEPDATIAGTSAAFTYDPETHTAKWDFPVGVGIEPAIYTARLANPAGIESVADQAALSSSAVTSRTFYVAIPGDLNLDMKVDVFGDGFPYSANAGNLLSRARWGDGDFNGDGAVEVFGDGFTLLSNIGNEVEEVAIPDTDPVVLESFAKRLGDFDGDGGLELINDNAFTGAGNSGLNRERWTVKGASAAGDESWGVFRIDEGGQGLPSRHVTGDFNGDGRTDLLATFGSSGDWQMVQSRTPTTLSPDAGQFVVFGTEANAWGVDNTAWSSWGSLQVGDFNGDGRDDVAGYDQGKGEIKVAFSEGFKFSEPVIVASSQIPLAWQKAVVVDFNGDGRDDLWMGQAGAAAHFVAISDGTRFNFQASGLSDNSWVESYVGDFDGDGAQELIGRSEANPGERNGQWQALVFDSVTGGLVQQGVGYALGTPSQASASDPWVITVGDANGDGRDDLVGYSVSAGPQIATSQGGLGGWFDSENTEYVGGPFDWFGATSYALPGVNVVADVEGRYQEVVDIFSDVYNNVELELYPGLKKGPEATFESKAGNSWDQAALLVDRFEEAGLKADLVYGQIEVGYDALKDWLGLKSAVPATIVSVLKQGVDKDAYDNQLGSIVFDHAWVRVRAPAGSKFEDIDVDPSWKFKNRQDGLELDLQNFLLDTPSDINGRDGRGFFDEFGFLQSSDATDLPAEWFQEQVMHHLVEQGYQKSLAELAYDGPIINQQFEVLPLVVDSFTVRTAVFEPEVFDNYLTITNSAVDRARFTHRVVVSAVGRNPDSPGREIIWAHEFVAPLHSQDAIHVDYTVISDGGTFYYTPRLLLNGNVVKEDLGYFHYKTVYEDATPPKVPIVVQHFQPTFLSQIPQLEKQEYKRLANHVSAISLDAGQSSATELARRAENVNKLLDGGQEHRSKAAIDELLVYMGAKYWSEFNRLNAISEGLLGAVAIEPIVRSAVFSATNELEDIEDTSFEHFQFQLLPQYLEVDVQNPHYVAVAFDSQTGLLDEEVADELAQLVGWNYSALEHMVIEQVVGTESISSVRGLKNAFDNTEKKTNHENEVDGLLVFERETVGGNAVVHWRGNIGKDIQLRVGELDPYGHPISENLRTLAADGSSARAYAPTLSLEVGGVSKFDFESVLLKHHDYAYASKLWESITTPEVTDATLIVPYLSSKLGDTDGAWAGSVDVTKTVADNDDVERGFRVFKNGSEFNGGASGGSSALQPRPEGLPTGFSDGQTRAIGAVTVGNGNLYRDEADFRFPNRGLPLDWTRHYDAQSDFDVGLGVGWVHSFTGVLYLDNELGDNETEQDGNTKSHDRVVWLRGDGSRHTFTWDADANAGNGRYREPSSLHGQIFAGRDGDGRLNEFKYVEKDGTVYDFTATFNHQDDRFGGWLLGRLNRVTDRNGTRVVVKYDDSVGVPGRNVKVNLVEDFLLGTDAAEDGVIRRGVRVTYNDGLGEVLVEKVDRDEVVQTVRYEVKTGPGGGLAGFGDGKADSSYRLVFADSDNDQAGIVYEYYTSDFFTGRSEDPRIGMMRAAIQPEHGLNKQYEYFPNRRVFKVKTSRSIAGTALADQKTYDQVFSYDLARNVTELTDENGNTEFYYHRSDGRLVKQQHPDGSYLAYSWGAPDPAQQVIPIFNDLLLSATDETGAVEGFEYYRPYQNVNNKRRFGELKSHQTKDGIRTDYTYFVSPDSTYEHISEIYQVIVDPVTDSDNVVINPSGEAITTTYGRNVIGDLLTTTDPLGHITTLVRHFQSGTVPRYLWGKVKEQTLTAAGEPVPVYTTRFEYDIAGNVVSQATDGPAVDGPITADQITDASPVGRQFYDHHGNVIWQQDATGVGVATRYDAQGRPIETWTVSSQAGRVNFENVLPTVTKKSLEDGRTLQLNGGDEVEVLQAITVANVTGGAVSPTILEFDFRSDAGPSSLQELRFSNGGNNVKTIRIQGSGPVDGQLVETVGYSQDGVWQHYRVNLSTLAGVPGSYDRVTFENVGGGELGSSFSNVRIFDDTPEVRETGNQRWNYTADGPLIQSFSADAGEVTNYVYDDRGRLVQVIAPDYTFNSTQYDAVGNAVENTDATGATTSYVYDSRHRIIQSIQADGATLLSQLDGTGRVVRANDALGDEVSFKYDRAGRQLESTHELRFAGDATTTVTTTNGYDGLGRLRNSVDGEGNIIQFVEYDKLGRVIEQRVLNMDPPNGLSPVDVAPLSVSRTFYDARGNVTEVASIDAANVILASVIGGDGRVDGDNPYVQKIVNQYDAFGRLEIMTNADGTQEAMEYDAAGRPTVSYDELERITESQYDEYGRLVKQILPDPDGDGTRQSLETEYLLSSAGRVLEETTNGGPGGTPTAPVSTSVAFRYDPSGRLVYSDDALNQRTRFYYDAEGRQTSVVDALNNSSHVVYDQLGRAVATQGADPDGAGPEIAPTAQTQYDAVGRVVRQTDSNGDIVDSEYDSLGRQRRVITWQDIILDDAAADDAFFVGSNGSSHNPDAAGWGGDTTTWDNASGEVATWTHGQLEDTGTYRIAINGASFDGAPVVAQVLLDGVPIATVSTADAASADRFLRRHGNTPILWLPLTEISGQEGKTLSITLTGSGSGAMTADAVMVQRKIVSETEYDLNGSVTATIDPLNRRTDYQVDSLGRTTLVSLPTPGGVDENDVPVSLVRSNVTTSYNGFGNVVTTSEYRGDAVADLVSHFEYDKRNRMIEERIEDGSVDGGDLITTYQYDAVGNVVKSTDPLGRVTVSVYDDLSQVVETTVSLGEGRPDGNLTFDSVSPGSLIDSGQGLQLVGSGSTQHHYAELPSSSTIKHNTVLEFELDSSDPEAVLYAGFDANNLFEASDQAHRVPLELSAGAKAGGSFVELLPNGRLGFHLRLGDLLTGPNQNGVDANYLFFSWENSDGAASVDLFNFKLYETDAVVSAVEYDTRGNVVATEIISDPRGIVTRNQYDALNRVQQVDEVYHADAVTSERKTSFDYDAVGNVLTETNHSVSPAQTTTYRYDNLYQQIFAVQPDPATGGEAEPDDDLSGRPHTRLIYDATGDVIQSINGKGESTRSAYDSFGQVISTWDGNGAETRFRYDAIGNTTDVIDAEGNRTSFGYDNLNRQIRETDQLGNSRYVIYSDQGNIDYLVDKNGRKLSFQYDHLNRITHEHWGERSIPEQLQWEYDDASRVVRQNDGDVVQTFQFDDLDRLTAQTNFDPTSPSATEPNVRHQYRYEFTPDSDQTIVDQYLIDAVGDQHLGTQTLSYDSLQRLESLTADLTAHDVADTVNFEWYADNGLKRISRTHANPIGGTTSSVGDSDYTYDAGGRLQQIEHLVDGSTQYQYLYDLANRIDGFNIYRNGTVVRDQAFGYDADGQLTNDAGTEFVYDDNGNRTSVNGTAVVTDAANRIQTDGTYDYDYDLEGNLLTRTEIATGQVRRFEWDYRNRLVKVTDHANDTGPAINSQTYRYDAADQLIQQGPTATEGQYLVHENGHVALTFDLEPGGPSLGHRYLYGISADHVLLDQAFSDGAVESLWLLEDHQNSVRQVADSGGTIRKQVDYDAFGNIVDEQFYDAQGGALDASPLDLSNVVAYDPAPATGSGGQDGQFQRATDATASADGTTLTLTGNAWKAIEINYDVTPDTILEFEFYAGLNEGELHGLVFDNDLVSSTTEGRNVFGLWGRDSQGATWKNRTETGSYPDYDEFSPGTWQTYRINIGEVFTGEREYLVFVNDNDADPNSTPSGTSRFRNVRLSESNLVDQSHYYTGRPWDSVSETYDYRARRYDPGTGRFLSEDPLGLTPDSNPYRYVGNSSPNYVDPSGQSLVGAFLVKAGVAALSYLLTGTTDVPGAEPTASGSFGVGGGSQFGGSPFAFVDQVSDFTAGTHGSVNPDQLLFTNLSGSLGSQSVVTSLEPPALFDSSRSVGDILNGWLADSNARNQRALTDSIQWDRPASDVIPSLFDFVVASPLRYVGDGVRGGFNYAAGGLEEAGIRSGNQYVAGTASFFAYGGEVAGGIIGGAIDAPGTLYDGYQSAVSNYNFAGETHSGLSQLTFAVTLQTGLSAIPELAYGYDVRTGQALDLDGYLRKGSEASLGIGGIAGSLAGGAGFFRAPSSAARPRLPQDINVNPVPPAAKPLNRPVGRSATQNARAQRDAARLQRAGAEDVRINQQQVNGAGERVGINRPDLQYTNPRTGQRVSIEYERTGSTRGPVHQERILANDPSARVRIRENSN